MKEFGPAATVGLWNYAGLTNNGDSFELNWQSDLNDAGPDVEPLVGWWFRLGWMLGLVGWSVGPRACVYALLPLSF